MSRNTRKMQVFGFFSRKKVRFLEENVQNSAKFRNTPLLAANPSGGMVKRAFSAKTAIFPRVFDTFRNRARRGPLYRTKFYIELETKFLIKLRNLSFLAPCGRRGSNTPQ